MNERRNRRRPRNMDISRGQFLKTTGIAAAGAGAAAVGLAGVARAVPTDPWVPDVTLVADPNHTPEQHRNAIQSAVDSLPSGGKLLLKGTFDLGQTNAPPYVYNYGVPAVPFFPWPPLLITSENPAFWNVAEDHKPKSIFLTKDVEIRGESGTTIFGGYRSFTIGLPPIQYLYDVDLDEGIPYLDNGGLSPIFPAYIGALSTPNVKLRNLRFQNPLAYAIYAASSGGLDVSGCEFVDATALPWRYWFGNSIGKCVLIGSIWPLFVLGQAFYNNKVFGSYMLNNNLVEGNARTVPWGSGQWQPNKAGIQVAFADWYIYGDSSQPASFTISNNTIRNFFASGLVLSAIHGTVNVTGNSITTGVTPKENNYCMFYREGGYLGEGDPQKAKAYITDNVFVQSPNPGVNDTAFWFDNAMDAVVSKNRITANTGVNAIGINNDRNCIFSNNKINGTAATGVELYGNSTGNILKGDNIVHLDCDVTYYLGPQTSENTILGYSGTVDDETITPQNPDGNNFITGLTPMKGSGGIGQKQVCEMKGGKWDDATQSCLLPTLEGIRSKYKG